VPPRESKSKEPQRRRSTSAGTGADTPDRRYVSIVGIGASAGGIEALKAFFEAMPADSGLAFVVVLHLDPTQASDLAPLLGRHTAMPVVAVVDGMPVEPNRVHVIVPDRSLTVRDGRLRLAHPAEPRGHRHPVDDLFASLASDQGERAIAVVLSGMGSNGTHGMMHVKANGGMTLVQEPGTAQFDGMPRNAIAAGVADHVLAPDKMPAVILEYARHAYVADPGGVETEAPEGPPPIDPMLALLRIRSGHDFRSYKRSTLLRRIHRRLGLNNMSSLSDYAELLRSSPEEIKALVKDLMISVTGFFRDPDAWRTLDETVLAPLVAERKPDSEIRIWVPACATGEEAYSVAMLAIERAEAARKPLDLRVFATDSQEDNLNAARQGIYPQAAAAAVPPQRLQRFFDRLDATYQVKRELRELLVFAPQNLLRDPPFSRLDLVTCRNLLIYLEPEAQRKAVALFHFALRENGHLFLGNAETVGRHDDLFETVSKKWRIYRRLGPTRHDIVEFPLFGGPARAQHAADPAQPATHQSESPARAADVARRELLERFAPASVLVDRKGRILYFHGPTGDYLEPPPGEPTRDLLAMAREGLRARLRAAMRDAAEGRRTVTFDAQLNQRGESRPVSVTVAPVAAAQAGGSLLVCFEPDPKRAPTSRPAARDDAVDEDARGQHVLEEELTATRAELQSTIEQMESANEELKAANEEVTSMNEELQSTNEELETSKEELQSYNEELHTINNQLQHKIQELENLVDDQSNLLAGTDLATIFLDRNGRIKWFSPASRALLDLVPSDIGRPLGHFATKFVDPDLPRDIERVQETLSRIETEVRSVAGGWYLRRLLPYRTQDNRIAGVVLTFADITERKNAVDAMEEERVYARAVVETVRQPLLVLGADLRVHSANRAFYALFDVAPEETEHRLIYELGNGEWDIPRLRALLEEVLPRDEAIENFVVEHDFERIGRRTVLLNARRLSRSGGRADLMLLAIDDVTVRSQAEAHRDILLHEMSHRVKNVLATVQSVASQTLRQSGSLDAFKGAFEGRLQALARAHDLLVDEGWAGADIRELVKRTLAPYRESDGDAERVAMDGPKVSLRPHAGVALVMILHELATNAAKYGALSAPGGALKVTWRVDDGAERPQVRLRWMESGGPPVAAPSHRGFGTSLIERGTAHELRGKATLDYRTGGMHAELTFPWQAPDPPPPLEPGEA
jgi:two-component system CheB/CheR fusion protein